MTRHAPSPTANAQDVTATHTPGPWECINATQHHGFYIVSPWGGTVCDLYTMSNPTAASVRNGGDSFPIAHQEGCDEANARLIAAAPDLNGDGSFLAERLREFSDIVDTPEAVREFYGHVLPALERFERTLTKVKTA